MGNADSGMRKTSFAYISHVLTHNGNTIGTLVWDTSSLGRTVPTLQDVA